MVIHLAGLALQAFKPGGLVPLAAGGQIDDELFQEFEPLALLGGFFGISFLIALASVAGVALLGRNVTIGTAPINAALPARPRNWRREELSDLRIWCRAFLFAQRCEIRHDILDLLG